MMELCKPALSLDVQEKPLVSLKSIESSHIEMIIKRSQLDLNSVLGHCSPIKLRLF